ncbi:MAG: agmatine deiminase family protein [candidate division WOR-3 bacterium]|nr:agmatine deiminase family protein [candidate division WOR-3 bacterium]
MNMLLLAAVLTASGEPLLPQWMTKEESLMVDEIGRGHRVTAPPDGWVETPAEFEQLRGIFVTWIYGSSSTNPIFRQIVEEAGEICRVYIIVGSTSEQNSIISYLQSYNISLDSLYFYVWPRNSIWIRDYGPWFMREHDNAEGIVDFMYNRPRPLDDTIPWRIGQSWGIPVYGSPLEHAGGNFMVDGLGTGFASTLIQQENPWLTTTQIESLMLSYSGLDQFVILPRINIEYTGHIDLWTKILNDTLVMVGEYAPGHPNYTMLNDNADSISRCTNREGFPYRIVRIPMPWSTSDAPPSYLNSLFVNNKVLVPLYNLAEDDTALFVYQQALPDHEIIGIDCAAMSGSGGAIHCITITAPEAEYIHVRHYPLPNTIDTLNDYRIRAEITTSSALISDSTLIYYCINDGVYTTVPLGPVVDTPGVYSAYIPAQHADDTIHYYLAVQNEEGTLCTSPKHVPPQSYSFVIEGNPGVYEHYATDIFNGIVASPNPTRDNISFNFDLHESAHVRIAAYNVLGQLIRIITDATFDAGHTEIFWDLSDEQGNRLPRGAYFYRMYSNLEERTGKILLIE